MGKTTSKLTCSHFKQEYTVTAYKAGVKTIPACLKFYSQESPYKEALIFASTDGDREVVTFKELFERSLQVAHVLVSLGIKPKECVAISLRTCPEWLYIAFGATIAGAIPFGLNFTYNDGRDMIVLMEKIQKCRFMVMDPGFEDINWNIMAKFVDDYSSDGKVVCKQLPSLRYLFAHKPGASMPGIKLFTDLLSDNVRDDLNETFPEVREDDIAMLFQTSGSTGYPKLIAHSHLSITSSNLVDKTEIHKDEDIYFCERPFEWLMGFPSGLFIGQTRVTCSGFCTPPENKAKFLAKTIKDENCNLIVSLPVMLQEIAKMKADFGIDLKLKSILTGGTPITQRLFSGLESLTNYFYVGYGGSECFCISANIVSDSSKYVDYDNGPLFPGVEVKIVDEDGEVVPINTQGEIYVKTDILFKEYFNDPEKTKAVVTPDGWYKTDDIGRMADDGSLFVEGRKSFMIISGGFNVNPEILETLIKGCPGIDSVVVVPVPDDVMYQVVCACVKITKGSNLDEAGVRRFCEEAHSDKRGMFTILPTYYLILDTFPETTSGKISRSALTDIAQTTFRK